MYILQRMFNYGFKLVISKPVSLSTWKLNWLKYQSNPNMFYGITRGDIQKMFVQLLVKNTISYENYCNIIHCLVMSDEQTNLELTTELQVMLKQFLFAKHACSHLWKFITQSFIHISRASHSSSAITNCHPHTLTPSIFTCPRRLYYVCRIVQAPLHLQWGKWLQWKLQRQFNKSWGNRCMPI